MFRKNFHFSVASMLCAIAIWDFVLYKNGLPLKIVIAIVGAMLVGMFMFQIPCSCAVKYASSAHSDVATTDNSLHMFMQQCDEHDKIFFAGLIISGLEAMWTAFCISLFIML